MRMIDLRLARTDANDKLAEKYQRQTGRTQATLLAAHAALTDGHAVLLVMRDARECAFAERRLDAMSPRLQSRAWRKLQLASADDGDIARGQRFDVVLVDHHADAALAADARKKAHA